MLLAAEAAGAERDLVLLAGTEPNLRWRTFSEALAEAAEALGVEMVITLGALIADVAHTLPVPITGLASDADLVDAARPLALQLRGTRPGSSASSTTPAAAAGCLGEPLGRGPPLRRRGPQPEGRPGAASPARGPGRRRGGGIRAGGGVRVVREPGSRAVAANPEIAEMVQRLEEQQSEQLDLDEEVPSGEALAREFERYLRQQGGSNP